MSLLITKSFVTDNDRDSDNDNITITMIVMMIMMIPQIRFYLCFSFTLIDPNVLDVSYLK